MKENLKGHWFQTFTTVVILLGLTSVIYLYTSGYRLSKGDNRDVKVDLKRTGLIRARSNPEAANVYINGVLYTATNDTIPALDPGSYKLRIVKDGYIPWEKDVEVFAELVTDITALLISQTPRLEPLTNTGARVPAVSPSLSKLAYFSKDGKESGIWVIPLANSGIGLFRSDPFAVIKDTFSTIFSNGKSIEWSPDEDTLLVQTDQDIYYVVDINAKTTETTASPELLRTSWKEVENKAQLTFLEKLNVGDDIKNKALDPTAIWAPDQKKFLFIEETDSEYQYKIFNLEKPLPVGEKIETIALTVPKEENKPNVYWYADSFHLIVVEGNIEEEKNGTISLLRIDGTNKIEVYNNTMYSPSVYSTPTGDKMIFLTSFRSNEQTDLYTIGIR